MTEQCGTPAYIAPEILKDRGYEGFGVDIWSSGVVLYAMLYGIVPFRANNMAELQKMIIRADYKLQDCISKDARDILSGLLEKDPAKRLTTRQIMAHPWMQDAKDKVELFTQAEKNYIRSEYTYTDKSRFNRNNDTKSGLFENESDAFVDAMLDTNENSILKNAETKSVILAPFNSTKSHIETGSQFLEQVRDLLEDRRVIKFAPRVREIAKQYEVNNNAELDNGVQHDFLEEEAKLKVRMIQKWRFEIQIQTTRRVCFSFVFCRLLLKSRKTRSRGRSSQALRCLTS
jgi:serine/threonine protein kinase